MTSSAQYRGWRPLLQRWLPLACIVTVACWLHWPGGTVFKSDDYAVIRYVTDWRNCLSDFFGPQYDLNFFKFYRPFITLSFGINYWLNGTEPFGYYLTSLLALLASAVLLHAIVATVSRSRPLAFAATLLWISHPAVVISQRCWAAGRVDTHVVPPLLLALFLHLRARRGGPRWPVWLAALWALGTKESALCLPFLALGLDLLDPLPSQRRSRLPAAWPYLLLVPAFFLFRRAVLGDWVGGYILASTTPIDPLPSLLSGLHVLSASFLPGAPPVLAWTGAGALAAALVWRRALHAQGHLRCTAGVLLITTGLFLPLVQMLPAMRSYGDLRWAYLICAWLPLLWTALVADLFGAARWRWVPLALLPLLWLLPARNSERAAMDHHDRFVTSVVAAMRECDALLPPDEPVVMAGDADLLMHAYRFTWGLGSVLKPPWQPRERQVVALCGFVEDTVVPAADLVCPGLSAWVEVHADGGTVVTATAAPRQRAAPSAFDGTLTAELVDRLLDDASPGFAVGPQFDGRVAVCTTRGSAIARVEARNGSFSLRDLLVADISSRAGVVRSLCSYAWVPADMDKDCPIFLVWREGDQQWVGRLAVGDGFVERYLELTEAAAHGRPLR